MNSSITINTPINANPTIVTELEIMRPGLSFGPSEPPIAGAEKGRNAPPLRSLAGATGFVSLGLLLLATVAPAAFAGPSVTIAGQPIQVQGTVETLDDALHQPYFQSGKVLLEYGKYGSSVSFSVPAGKRLVIETLAFRVIPSGDENILVYLTTQTGPYMTLPLQSRTNWGIQTVYTSTIPVRIRVDSANAGGSISVTCSRDSANGSASFDASVSGYLVDL